MNSCFLVGRIQSMPEPTIPSRGTTAEITVSCRRAFPEPDGSYVTDLFSVRLWNGIAEETRDSCQIGDPIAIRGRLVNENGTRTLIVAEHVSRPNAF
ncbi:MAG: single-stranded DNA-binding protein [Bulleidia sp.]